MAAQSSCLPPRVPGYGPDPDYVPDAIAPEAPDSVPPDETGPIDPSLIDPSGSPGPELPDPTGEENRERGGEPPRGIQGA